MQNGENANRREIAAASSGPVDYVPFLSTSKTSRNGPGLLKTSRNAPGLFYTSATPHSPCLSMSNVADSWSQSGVPLFTNGTASQLNLRRNISLPETAEGEAKVSSSNSSCSALKERDYIGLWNSSPPSVQGVRPLTAISSPNFGAKAFDLHAKDTELRLGLVPSLIFRKKEVQVDAAQNGLPGEAKSDGNKICVPEQIRLPEQQHVGLSQANARKNCPEQFLPAHDGNGGENGISENVPLSAPHLATRAYGTLGSFPSWNGEQQLLSQRGPLPLQGKSYCSVEGIANANNPKQNDLSMQEARHHFVNGQALTAKSLNGSSELKFAPHDLMASTDTVTTYDAAAAQKFWQFPISRPIEGFRAPSGQDGNVTEVLLAPGRFAVPLPKVSTVPAKRPFLDAIGDHNRTSYANDCKSDARGNVVAVGAPAHGGMSTGPLGTLAIEGEATYGPSQPPKVHTASGFFPWNNVVPLPAGWQPMTAQFKAPAANMLSNEPVNEAQTPTKSGKESQNEDDRSRAPVVGWPPIRSFRKNTLAAHSRSNEDDQDVAGEASTTHYVKAKLDGAKVQRKVDLKSCSGYESLKLALQDLFQAFINGHNGGPNTGESEKFDLVHGSDYVIANEDTDGDLMLAGDVPWELFVTTVKRLRIMKASEAIGLGQRGSGKLRTPVNG